MGHRAIVAYEREDGRFDVRYSHWGGHDLALCTDITPETPLGGENVGYEPSYVAGLTAALREAAEDADAELGGALTERQEPTPVKPEPLAVGVKIEDVCDLSTRGFHVEGVYVVTQSFEVRGFQPLIVPFADRGSLLIEPRWVDDDPVSNSRDRGWFRGMCDELDRFVADGLISESEAADRAVDHALERFEDALSKQVLAHSTALTDADRARRPTACVQMTGQTRMHDRGDRMLPSGYKLAEAWELPEGFALPEPVQRDPTANPFELASGD
jgi:hypothetical protein